MPRSLSRVSWNVLWWLWQMPLASASDLAMVLRYEENTVANFLSRAAKEKLWVDFADLGRLGRAVHRFAFNERGIREIHEQRGWPLHWWHSADGVNALANRLQVLEMAYAYLPSLWVSNLVKGQSCFECVEVEHDSEGTSKQSTQMKLEEMNWRGGRLHSLHWVQRGPFEVIAQYWLPGDEKGRTMHMPVLSCTRYTRRTLPSSVFEHMKRGLIEDDQREHLGVFDAESALYRPGAVALCSDAVCAAMVQRDWVESVRRDRREAVRLGIIDADGQIYREMETPTNHWSGIKGTGREVRLVDIGKVSDAVAGLRSGAYASVNGAPAWRLFNTYNNCPGLTLPLAGKLARVDGSVARKLSQQMEEQGVIWAEGRDKSRYLDEAGVELVASSQKVDMTRANRQWKGYLERSGRYRLRQRRHNQGQAEVIILLREWGYRAFANPGFSVGYGEGSNRISVIPDAFVVLPPGTLNAVEYERTATAYRALERKAGKYEELRRINCPLPVLFVMEKMAAARALAELGYSYVQVTSIEALRQEQQGQILSTEGEWTAEPGCWLYRLPGTDVPEERMPIDYVSYLYAATQAPAVWKMPLDNSFKVDLGVRQGVPPWDPPWAGDPDYMPGSRKWGRGTWLT